MKIININRRSVGQTEVALPFETDRQVRAAWEYLVAGLHLADFSYRPESEGEDQERANIASYLLSRHRGDCVESPEADQIRRMIPKIWGAELDFDVRELLNVPAG
jgi:hypothetical protein